MASDSEVSCVGDPNFAVVCGFLDKFGVLCGITSPDFDELQDMLEDHQEVSPELIDLHVKLLRKARRTVSGDRWERALIKFCHLYCSQDAWELERFGYKKARLTSKLRILKTLLEMQFDLNQKFKVEINRQTAKELRTEPIGRDKHGHAYWYQVDEQCQIRVYREDPDEETWILVAKDRDGLVQLISQLCSDDPACGDLALNEEDSSSLEIEKPIMDTGQVSTSPSCIADNEDSTTNDVMTDENKIELDEEDIEQVQIKEEEVPEIVNDPDKYDNNMVESIGIDLRFQPKGIDLTKRKKSINDLATDLRMKSQDTSQEQEIDLSMKKTKPENKLFSSLSVPPFDPISIESALHMTNFEEGFEEDDEIDLSSNMKRPRLERPTLLVKKFDKYNEEGEFNDEIQDPVIIVQGEGSGQDCNSENQNECGEPIEEPLMMFFGEGSGHNCDTGNTGKDDSKDSKSESEHKSDASSCAQTINNDGKNIEKENTQIDDTPDLNVQHTKIGMVVLDVKSDKSVKNPVKKSSRWDVGEPAKQICKMPQDKLTDMGETSQSTNSSITSSGQPVSDIPEIRSSHIESKETELSSPSQSNITSKENISKINENDQEKLMEPSTTDTAVSTTKKSMFFFGPGCVTFKSNTFDVKQTNQPEVPAAPKADRLNNDSDLDKNIPADSASGRNLDLDESTIIEDPWEDNNQTNDEPNESLDTKESEDILNIIDGHLQKLSSTTTSEIIDISAEKPTFEGNIETELSELKSKDDKRSVENVTSEMDSGETSNKNLKTDPESDSIENITDITSTDMTTSEDALPKSETINEMEERESEVSEQILHTSDNLPHTSLQANVINEGSDLLVEITTSENVNENVSENIQDTISSSIEVNCLSPDEVDSCEAQSSTDGLTIDNSEGNSSEVVGSSSEILENKSSDEISASIGSNTDSNQAQDNIVVSSADDISSSVLIDNLYIPETNNVPFIDEEYSETKEISSTENIQQNLNANPSRFENDNDDQDKSSPDTTEEMEIITESPDNVSAANVDTSNDVSSIEVYQEQDNIRNETKDSSSEVEENNITNSMSKLHENGENQRNILKINLESTSESNEAFSDDKDNSNDSVSRLQLCIDESRQIYHSESNDNINESFSKDESIETVSSSKSIENVEIDRDVSTDATDSNEDKIRKPSKVSENETCDDNANDKIDKLTSDSTDTIEIISKEETDDLSREGSYRISGKEGDGDVSKDDSDQVLSKEENDENSKESNDHVLIEEESEDVSKGSDQVVIEEGSEDQIVIKEGSDDNSNESDQVLIEEESEDVSKEGSDQVVSKEDSDDNSKENEHDLVEEENEDVSIGGSDDQVVMKEESEDDNQESDHIITEEGNEDVSKEGSDQILIEESEDMSKEGSDLIVIKEESDDNSQESDQVISEEGSEEVSKEGSEEVSKEGSEEVSKEGSDQVVSKEESDDNSQKSDQVLTEDGSEDVSKEGSDQVVSKEESDDNSKGSDQILSEEGSEDANIKENVQSKGISNEVLNEEKSSDHISSMDESDQSLCEEEVENSSKEDEQNLTKESSDELSKEESDQVSSKEETDDQEQSDDVSKEGTDVLGKEESSMDQILNVRNENLIKDESDQQLNKKSDQILGKEENKDLSKASTENNEQVLIKQKINDLNKVENDEVLNERGTNSRKEENKTLIKGENDSNKDSSEECDLCRNENTEKSRRPHTEEPNINLDNITAEPEKTKEETSTIDAKDTQVTANDSKNQCETFGMLKKNESFIELSKITENFQDLAKSVVNKNKNLIPEDFIETFDKDKMYDHTKYFINVSSYNFTGKIDKTQSSSKEKSNENDESKHITGKNSESSKSSKTFKHIDIDKSEETEIDSTSTENEETEKNENVQDVNKKLLELNDGNKDSTFVEKQPNDEEIILSDEDENSNENSESTGITESIVKSPDKEFMEQTTEDSLTDVSKSSSCIQDSLVDQIVDVQNSELSEVQIEVANSEMINSKESSTVETDKYLCADTPSNEITSVSEPVEPAEELKLEEKSELKIVEPPSNIQDIMVSNSGDQLMTGFKGYEQENIVDVNLSLDKPNENSNVLIQDISCVDRNQSEKEIQKTYVSSTDLVTDKSISEKSTGQSCSNVLPKTDNEQNLTESIAPKTIEYIESELDSVKLAEDKFVPKAQLNEEMISVSHSEIVINKDICKETSNNEEETEISNMSCKENEEIITGTELELNKDNQLEIEKSVIETSEISSLHEIPDTVSEKSVNFETGSKKILLDDNDNISEASDGSFADLNDPASPFGDDSDVSDKESSIEKHEIETPFEFENKTEELAEDIDSSMMKKSSVEIESEHFDKFKLETVEQTLKPQFVEVETEDPSSEITSKQTLLSDPLHSLESVIEPEDDVNESDPLACTEEDIILAQKIEEKEPAKQGFTLSTWKLDDTDEIPVIEPITRKLRNRQISSEQIETRKRKVSGDSDDKAKIKKIKGKIDSDIDLRKSTESKEGNISSTDEGEDKEDTEVELEQKVSPRRGWPRGRGRRGRGRKSSAPKTVNENNPAISSDAPLETSVTDTTSPIIKTPAKKKKIHRLLGLELDPEIIEESKNQPEDTETNARGTSVRQSRRIAQIKIKEEAERRKIQEFSLLDIKDEHRKKKKKKNDDKDYVEKGKKSRHVSDEDESGSEDEETIKKKHKKKKRKHQDLKRLFDMENPWQSSSESSSSNNDDEELDVEDEPSDDEVPYLKSDHEFSPESDLENSSEMQPLRRARTVKKESDTEDPVDDHACQKCSKSDHPEWILLCDNCDCGWHCSCLRPALLVIPEGDWFCPPCQHIALITNLKSQLIEYDKKVNKRDIEVRRKQRLAYVGISLDNVLPTKDEVVKLEVPEVEESESESDETESSSGSSSGDESEPIYQLRERRQAHSYRFNDYDELINSAIQDELEAVKGAGNQGRGKDIATIVNAEKEEIAQAQALLGHEQPSVEPPPPVVPIYTEPVKVEEKSDEESDEEPTVTRRSSAARKKHRKLNSLDVSSEDDDDDEDFKGTSDEEEEEFEEDLGSEDSEEIDLGRRKRGKEPIRRSTRARTTRYDRDFINDNSEDEEAAPRRKKSRSIWDESESEESDRSWGKNKRNKKKAIVPPKSIKKPRKKKKARDDDDDPDVVKRVKKPKIQYGGLNEDSDEGVLARRTRGKKINYLDALASDSEEETHKPAVKALESEEEYVANEEDEEDEIMDAIEEEIKDESDSDTDKHLMIPKKIIKLPKPIAPYMKGAVLKSKPMDPLSPRFEDLDDEEDDEDDEPGMFRGEIMDDEDEQSEMPVIAANPEGLDEEEVGMMMEEEEYANKQLELMAIQLAKEKKRKEKEAKKKIEKKDLIEPKKRGRKKREDNPDIPELEPQVAGSVPPMALNTAFISKQYTNKMVEKDDEMPILESSVLPTVLSEVASPPKRRGRGKGKKTIAAEQAAVGTSPFPSMASSTPSSINQSFTSAPMKMNMPGPESTIVSSIDSPAILNVGQIEQGKLGIAAPPQPFSQNQPTPSVITRMLQSQPVSAQTFTTAANAMTQKYFMSNEPRPQFARVPYRPSVNHYPIRNVPPNTQHRMRAPLQMFHSGHHPMDPSPSGGGPIMANRDRNSPAIPVSSPLGKGNPTPPPPPYSRIPPNRFSPNEPAPGPSIPSVRHHMPFQQSPPPRPQGNFSPYHPPPPPNYHYGAYPPPPSLTAADDALPPTAYQSSPYPEHYNPGESIAPIHSSEGSNSKPFDEEGSGEFGGLVSYFSSQREDDLDT